MSDPVADFMAREQEMLSELEGDIPGGVPPAPIPTGAMAAASLDDFADEFAPPAPAASFAAPADPVSIGGGDSGVDLAGLIDGIPPAPVQNGHMQNGGSSKGPSPVPSLPRVEAEKIRKWREEHAILLEKKDEAEEKKRSELREQAKKELAEWYAQREATLRGVRESNRKAERDHLAAFAKEQGEGAQWDEISKLCGDKTVKGGKDISRLKSMLMHLKEHNKK